MTSGALPAPARGARARVPPLRPAECQVWWARVDDVRPQHDALLADADLVRRARLRLPADRRRLTAAWALARLLLGTATGSRPDRLRIDRACPGCGAQHGKPWLPAAPDLHVSVAHSGDCVAVAVAWGSAVGVDVEAVVPLDGEDVDLLAGATLAAEERAELGRLAGEARSRAFTTWWTRKEAVVKATGDGLATPLEDLVVSGPPAPPQVLRWDGRCAATERMSLHELHPPDGFVATLAVLGPPASVTEADAGPLLQGAG